MHLSLLLCLLLFFTPTQESGPSPAVVSSSEATFTIAVKPRARWDWRLADTKDNQMEYRMDVTIKNEGKTYTFGFYLWKRHGTSPGSGRLSDLISVGQRSLFERSQSNMMTLVKDAEVKVKIKESSDDLVIITLKGKKNLERLFSSKPAEVTFKIKIPGETETSQPVPVIYR
jgi:hypothetical protein